MSKKIMLLVSYAFPPTGGPGVQRVAKFVKYLPAFGWQPVVLTVANPSVPVTDGELANDIPVGVEILHARTFEPGYHYKTALAHGKSRFPALLEKLKAAIQSSVVPDAQVLWWPALIPALVKVIRKRKPKCIFVSAPPFSCLSPVVGIAIFLKVPAIVDFRDEWGFNRRYMENSSKVKLLARLDKILERFAVSRAAAITAATESYLQGIRKRHPMIDLNKCRRGYSGSFSICRWIAPCNAKKH